MSGPWRPRTDAAIDGRYELMVELGVGPSGVVYAAQDTTAGEVVALKCIHPDLLRGPSTATNLVRLQRARGFVHPNIVRLHDVIVGGPHPSVVVARVDAPDLAAWRASGSVPDSAIQLAIIESIAKALTWIHQIGVHGNLKPSNIFIGEGLGGAPEVLIGDPWRLVGHERMTEGALPKVDSAWLAPEQRQDGTGESSASDVHGLGLVLGYMIAGHAVTGGRLLRDQGVDVPEELDRVFLRATAPSIAARFAKPIDVVAAARGAFGRFGPVVAPPIPMMAGRVGDQTETVPAEALIAMGLDPGLDGDGEVVEATLWVGGEGDEGVVELDFDDIETLDDALSPLDPIAEMGLAPVVAEAPAKAVIPVDLTLNEQILDLEDPDLLVAIEAVMKGVAKPPRVPPKGDWERDPNDVDASAASAALLVTGAAAAGTGLSRTPRGQLTRNPVPTGASTTDPRSRPVVVASPARTAVSPQGVAREKDTHKRRPIVWVSLILALLALGFGAFVWNASRVGLDDVGQGGVAGQSEGASGGPILGGAASEQALASAHKSGDGVSVGTEPDVSGADGGAADPQGGPGVDGGASPVSSLIDVATGGVGTADGGDSDADSEDGDTGPAAESDGDAKSVADGRESVDTTDGTGASVAVAPDEGAKAKGEKEGTTKANFIPTDPKKLKCPGGMAKVRRRVSVTLDDGSKASDYEVVCVDRFEHPGKGASPTVNIGLGQAKASCRSRGKRLCTKKEWRRGCGARYPYGRTYESGACNTVGDDGIPRPVGSGGSRAKCRSGWGIYDAVGNVAEWTSDGSVNGGSAKNDGPSSSCYKSGRRIGGSAYVGFRCCADPQ